MCTHTTSKSKRTEAVEKAAVLYAVREDFEKNYGLTLQGHGFSFTDFEPAEDDDGFAGQATLEFTKGKHPIVAEATFSYESDGSFILDELHWDLGY